MPPATYYAHTRPIPQPACQAGCGKDATVEVYDTRNAKYGNFCIRCGKALVATLNKEAGS